MVGRMVVGVVDGFDALNDAEVNGGAPSNAFLNGLGAGGAVVGVVDGFDALNDAGVNGGAPSNAFLNGLGAGGAAETASFPSLGGGPVVGAGQGPALTD